MNYGGEAADQIVRMSLNGVEIAAKISGEAVLVAVSEIVAEI